MVECVAHSVPPGFWDLYFSADQRVIAAFLGRQEEVAVSVRFVVQEGDATFAHITGVVLHFNHQICNKQEVTLYE